MTVELNLKGSGYGLLEVLFQHLLGGTEEDHENLGKNSAPT
jgi:hypothetical protein